MTTRENNEAEFDQFLDFITLLCTELSSGISPEYALARSVHHFGEQSPSAMTEALKSIIGGTSSFVSAWTNITSTYQENRYRRILELVGRFLEKGARIGGTRMLQVLKQIRANLTLTKNRSNLIKAQRAKVIALAVVSSAVLGMVAGLAPILALAFKGLGMLNLAQGMQTTSSLHLFLILFLTAILSSYRLTQVVGSSTRTLLLCSLAFVTMLIFTINLLSAIP